jgi:phospholipase/carboxylesterase
VDELLIRALAREPAGEAEGALVLLHGRGADERDLHPLLDALDPERRLLGVTPRGPLSLPPGGAHWYALGGLPTPDPATFWPTFEAASRWLDSLPVELERTVLGGFSQGAVMSWALGLGRGAAKRPAGIVALSGFVPQVAGLELDLTGLEGFPVAIGHGTFDDVIPSRFGEDARARLAAAGADVLHREYPLPHTIDPRFLPELRSFVARALAK